MEFGKGRKICPTSNANRTNAKEGPLVRRLFPNQAMTVVAPFLQTPKVESNCKEAIGA